MNGNANGVDESLASGLPAWLTVWRGVAWLLVLVVTALTVSPSTVPPGFDGGDKLQHLLAYMVLGFCFAVLYPRERRLSLLGLILLGAALEGVQGLLPVRMASPFDLLADALGVLLGIQLARSRARNLFGWLEQRILAAGQRLGHNRG